MSDNFPGISTLRTTQGNYDSGRWPWGNGNHEGDDFRFDPYGIEHFEDAWRFPAAIGNQSGGDIFTRTAGIGNHNVVSPNEIVIIRTFTAPLYYPPHGYMGVSQLSDQPELMKPTPQEKAMLGMQGG